ncbi:sensor histidine kinase [Paenibacillus eucommiae]|uniref:Two-component system sensor histidine kinase YesM n=1 Tax=Paenibacillus eucommiae TaxID=1355755 RepID=A0ABS4J1Q9_9BACL|nr:histidine kinase [Paenibacillus eucommiae]MBP1993772.1 two-component system sensor histidine kinase YesM [Paenibacillus eucommiae]
MNMTVFRRFSVYPKIVIAFLMVVMPLYMLGFAMNKSGSSRVGAEIQQSLESRVHFYLSSFEAEFLRIVTLRNEYVYDGDLQDVSVIAPVMTQYQLAQAVKRIMEKLKLLQSSSLYVSDIQVHIPLIQRTISTDGFVDPMSEEELLVFRNMKNNLDTSIVSWNNRLIIGGVYPEVISPSQEPLYAFEVELSADKIRQSLMDVDKNRVGGVLLLGENMEWAVSSDNDETAVSKMKTFLAEEQSRGLDHGSRSIKVDDTKYLAIYERSPVLNTTLLVYMPEREVLGQLKDSQIWLWWLSLTSVLIVAIFSLWIYRLIHRPVRKLVHALRKVEKGDLGVAIYHKPEDEFGYLYKQFNAMVRRLQVLIHEVYEQKLRSQRSELKQLQSQINPHFLYNSYFVLHQTVQLGETDKALRLSKHLGEYFRYITRNNADDVLLLTEWNHTLAYVEIQMLRFSRRMETRCGQSPALHSDIRIKEIKVPKLILQPIVENAYEHGLKETLSDGIVELKLDQGSEEGQELLLLIVEDNGAGLTDERITEMNRQLAAATDETETTGMINVHRRLQLKFGDSSGLVLSRSTLGGLRVEMKIRYEDSK